MSKKHNTTTSATPIRPTWSQLPVEEREERQHAVWLKTFMVTVGGSRQAFTHTDQFEMVWGIAKTEAGTWNLTNPELAIDDTYPRRRDAVHQIAWIVAEQAYDLGDEPKPITSPDTDNSESNPEAGLQEGEELTPGQIDELHKMGYTDEQIAADLEAMSKIQ